MSLEKAATERRGDKDLLRFITCGSVDDGKSTMIGRLLHDSRLVMDDTLAALARDSRKYGTQDDAIDLALLVDGLELEREQGITIDVAYCYFATPRRAFVVADTPGHEQYTRNMATGASTAQLAVILIDIRKGLLQQTKRHATICALLGVKNVVFAVNKIDLVGYDEQTFVAIAAEATALVDELGFAAVQCIPVSARDGDNIMAASDNTPWYRGPTLLQHLETVDVDSDLVAKAFRFPVQWVNRSSPDFRGYAGTVASGHIRQGDAVVVPTSGRVSRIREIITPDGPRDSAQAGDAVTLTLADEIDVARGAVLCKPSARPEISNRFAAHLLWMDEYPLIAGRSYLLRLGTQAVPAWISVDYKIDVNTREHVPAGTVGLNDIVMCNVLTGSAVAFDAYADNHRMGAFIVIDRSSNRTVAAGMITHSLQHGRAVAQAPVTMDKAARAAIKQQVPRVLWFTGLSGAGKSTIARAVERQLHAAGRHTMMLDGDQVRTGLSRGLGFSRDDRLENIRRVGEVAKLMVDAGLIVICAFISPYRMDRDMVRGLMQPGEFIEVFVDTSVEECVSRDSKGLYAHVQSGELTNFTGFDQPYERPENAEIHLLTAGIAPEPLADQVVQYLMKLELTSP